MTKTKDQIDKAYEIQEKSIIGEADKENIQITDIELIEFEQDSSKKNNIKKVLPIMFGGNMKHTAYKKYCMNSIHGKHHYIQPFSHVFAVPGEHHAKINGSFDSAVTIVPSRWKKRANLQLYIILGILTLGLGFIFLSLKPKVISTNKDLEKRLRKNKKIISLFSSLKPDWPVGTSVITLDWVFQIKPNGDGTSNIAMKTGRYGGFTTYKIGLSKFIDIMERLPQFLDGQCIENCEFDFPTLVELIEK